MFRPPGAPAEQHPDMHRRTHTRPAAAAVSTAARRRWAARPVGRVEPLENRRLLDSTVVFNEVMYHPSGDEAALEWVELHNQMAVDMDLTGWSVRGGIDYAFPAGTVIGGGEYMVVAINPAALQAATGYAGARGPFAGRLSNGGETLELRNNSNRLMDEVDYGDGGPGANSGQWPAAADGGGVSMAKIDPDQGSRRGQNWTASAQMNGTPGATNFPGGAPAASPLRINEVDAGGSANFFVELVHSSGVTQSVGGYVIKRVGDAGTNEYVLPANTFAAGGILSVPASQLGFTPAAGDRLFLINPGRTAVVDAVAVDTRTRGRVPPQQTAGRWVYPSQRTPGSQNVVQLNTGVVINEIMYNARSQAPSQAAVRLGLDSTWKYNQSGADLGTGWRETGYVDAGWSNGTAVFHAGDVSGVPGPNPARQAIPRLFGSGLDDAGRPLPVGAPDPHYVLVSSANGEPAGTPATVNAHHSAWQTDAGDPSSRWISINANGHSEIPAGVYRFRTTFDLSGFVPSTAELTLTLWADNRFTDVLINGRSAGVSSEGFWAPGGPFTIGSGFVNGINTLEFVGQNDGDGANPGGFRMAVSGTAQPVAKNTQLTLGPTTYYFRKTFDFAGDPAATKLLLSGFVDDGAIVYLNGTELRRQNMPAGAVTASTLASTVVAQPQLTSAIELPASALRRGTNVLAVEVHQGSTNSTDVAFGLELEALPLPAAAPPAEEWVELYNRSGATIDLTGWKLDDAIDYTFPAGTTLGAGQYLVVAKDASLAQALHPGARVIGNYGGNLSGKNEQILLTDAAGNPADDVHYYDGGRWPGYADHGGSSLELTDPDADNANPQAWAASDETARSGWRTYTYRGTANTVPGDPGDRWNEFVMGLLDSGEVLLDDIRVVEDPRGGAFQVLQNTTFQSDFIGAPASKWRIIGNHSGTVVTDPTNPANRVLKLVATGATEHMHNHAETTFTGNRPIFNGAEYEISFRAKWLAGSNQLNTRLWFNRLAETTLIDVPNSGGTPGAANSRRQTNIGPTYNDFRHTPVRPTGGQPVTVTAVAQDPDTVASMYLYYSVNGGAWANVAMGPTGAAGTYAGNVPGQAAGSVVQFYVRATDGAGATSTYPAAGANSRALYKVSAPGTNNPNTHDFQILMTAADTALMHRDTNVMSDQELGGTVVYESGEGAQKLTKVYYDVGVGLKSSQRGRLDPNRVGFNINFGPDNPFRGVHPTVSFDRSGGWSGRGGRNDEIVLKHMIQRAGGMPGMYDDIAHVASPTGQHDGPALVMMSRYGDEFLDSQYGDEGGRDGAVHKLELIYFPLTTDTGGVEGLKRPQPDDVIGIDIQPLPGDKDAYRWHYLSENNRGDDDYAGIMNMAVAFAQSGLALDVASQQAIDVDEWLRVFAMHTLVGDLDGYSLGYQHNLQFYTRPSDGKVLALPWDWDYAWTLNPEAGIIPGANIGRVISLPGNQHAYYGHVKNIIDRSFNTAYINTWANHYAALTGQNYSQVVSYIGQRANAALRQLPAQRTFQITTNNGNNFTTDQPRVTIAGDGWIDVREIYVAGRTQPLNVTWTDVDSWQATVSLANGANALTFQARNFDGAVIASDSITVTTTATPPRVAEHLRITELHYHPSDGPGGSSWPDGNEYEFVELQNIGGQPLNVGGAQLAGGVTFTFPQNYTIQPGRYVLVVNNTAAFQSRYGTSLPIAGEFDGTLANEGEPLQLLGPASDVILGFTYDDAWHPSTDGAGPSLVKLNPATAAAGTWGQAAGWQPSVRTAPGGSPGAADTAGPATPTVAGRHLFYNRSIYDNNDPLPNAADDAAVDATRTALLPGVAPGPANVTAYTRGINGVMIDIANPPPNATSNIGLNDVSVRTTSPTAPNTWSAGPAPSSVSVRPGPAGTARVTLLWPDGAIVNRWLEVTLLGNTDTGLTAPDVFWFGNLIGDADGNRTVNLADFGAVRGDFNASNLSIAAGRSDFNRDRTVNLADFGTLRANFGKSLPPPPSFAAAAAAAPVAMQPASETPATQAPPATAAQAPADPAPTAAKSKRRATDLVTAPLS